MQTTKQSAAALESSLAQFYGSDSLTRWSPLTRSLLSDGALYLAENAGAYWLFDAIDSHLTTRGANALTEFTVARLRRLPNDAAELTLDDGNGTIYATQRIEFTDFPLAEIKLYACYNGAGWTHLLPSEY